MTRKFRNYLLWALVLAEGLYGLTWMVLWLAQRPGQHRLGDALFLEGAVLLVAGGLVDVGRSLTVAHIRRIGRSRMDAPPPQVQKTGPTGYVLLLAGILLCLQGILHAYLAPPP
ncbi:MAG: hypothetical protein JSW39_11390 [Desulfobacterales bacterium]|nr:MAG: hypothetical protein JSW39_11390 [Desulfobacterales bacterium]